MENDKKNRGSITLEAAIVVPLFIILMLLVNGLFVMFMGQQIMTHTLIQSTKSLAFDPYATQRAAENDEDSLTEAFLDLFSILDLGGKHTSTENWAAEDSDADIPELAKQRFTAYLRESDGDAEKLLDQIGVKNGLEGLDFSGTTLEDGILTVKMKFTQEYIFNAAGLASFERELSVKVKVFGYSK